MKKFFAAIFACLLLLLAGCGSSQTSTKKATIDTEATTQLKQYLAENFGGDNPTSWYPLIKDIKVISEENRKHAEVETSIYNDSEGKKVGQSIATIVQANSPVKLSYTLVKDKDGWMLAKSQLPPR